MNNKTELYFDFFDEIAMILVSELGLSYLEAFHKTKEIILEDDWELNLPHEEIVKITTLTKALNKETFTQEDIRLALQLLTVKAYQAMNQKL